MTDVSDGNAGITIDELARQAQLPVRTIREYHTMRLLPPPGRRGRVGIYGSGHRQRLELITRLQRRGYSLAGIRDLLRAWDEGADLTTLLGVEPGPAVLDETPLRLSRAELEQRIPVLTGPALDRAAAAGLVKADRDGYLVRSPALLALVADGAAAGLPLDDLLDLVASVRSGLAGVAAEVADIIAGRLLPAVQNGPRPASLPPLLQRGRILLLQGTASTLADELGAALLRRSGDGDDGAVLRAAIEQVWVRAISDSQGNIRHEVTDDDSEPRSGRALEQQRGDRRLGHQPGAL